MAHGTSSTIRTIIPHSIALVTGYSIWIVLYAYIPVTQQYDAELSFFNTSEAFAIDAPETISVTLKAPRATLDTLAPVIHIDAQEIPLDVTHLHHIDHKNLLVPYLVEMVYCYPSVVSIIKTNRHCAPAFTETDTMEHEAL